MELQIHNKIIKNYVSCGCNLKKWQEFQAQLYIYAILITHKFYLLKLFAIQSDKKTVNKEAFINKEKPNVVIYKWCIRYHIGIYVGFLSI